MNEPVWANRPEPHSTSETMGTRCHMCEHLSCIERPTAKLHRWSYYCELLHRKMEQRDLYSVTVEMCPEHRKLRREGGEAMTDSKTATELLPCPCCGNADIKEFAPEEWGASANPYWKIKCKECGLAMCGTHRRMNQEAWNDRKLEQVTIRELEGLVADLRRLLAFKPYTIQEYEDYYAVTERVAARMRRMGLE